MKKTILITCLILNLIFLNACSEKAVDPSPVPPPPPPPSATGEATLSWDVVTINVEQGTITGEIGYRIYYGNESENYPWYKDVGTGNIEDNRVSYTINDLEVNEEYFFVVRAYSSGGESSNSNEVSMLIEETVE
ncbi:MAG: fibronectin type III domain-containing protein [Halanaerobiales bacterium]